jgi:hypothetical protein
MNFIVAIVCPETGWEVPTGTVTDITNFASLPDGEADFLCRACGRSHRWSRKDAFLAHTPTALDGYGVCEPNLTGDAPSAGGSLASLSQLSPQKATP